VATAAHFTQGELGLDDASRSCRVRPLPRSRAGDPPFHSTPPCSTGAHAWIRIGDTEAVLRALPLLFMIGQR